MMLRRKIIYSLTITGIILIFLGFTNIIYFSGDTLQINFNFSEYSIFGIATFTFIFYLLIFLVLMVVIFEMVRE